jgi:hypothetical protein
MLEGQHYEELINQNPMKYGEQRECGFSGNMNNLQLKL